MKSEYMSENSSQFISLNYHINKAVFKHELGRLKIVWKLLLDSTLYDTSACKSDKHLWLCDYDIAQ